MSRKESSFSEEKEAKRLLPNGSQQTRRHPTQKDKKFFGSFFQKKNFFLSLPPESLT